MPRGSSPRQPGRSGRQERTDQRKRPAVKVSNKKTGKGSKQAVSRPGKTVFAPKVKANTKRSPSKPAVKAISGYNPISPERINKIIAGLDKLYPEVTCALQHRTAWELLVATILSAQCTDVRVNMVTPALFEKYPAVEDFAALDPEQLQPDIRSTGFFRNKAKSLVGAARKLVAEFSGKVPETMDELLSLPGVARKTANVVLGTWFKTNIGLVVDTHVTRISRRLELTKHEDAPKIEQDLMQVIPQARWTDFSHQVIWHGRKLCVARGPRCAECPLETLCHAADKTWSTVDINPHAR